MSEREKPFKATPKYLPTIKYCLKPSRSLFKSEKLTVRAVMGHKYSLFHKKTKTRDPSCDVSCISTNIQDGGQQHF